MRFAIILSILVLLIASTAPAREVPLLAPSQGQLPTDIGSDDTSKIALAKSETGSRALRWERCMGDSFGDRAAKVTDWKPFVAVKFQAINPSQTKVELNLTVLHRRTTSYQTRVEMPFTLQPGKHTIRLGIDEMANVNGSTPDLAHVTRWYIACTSGVPPTLYFGDIVLEGDDPSPQTPTAAGPAVAYKITGTIGGQQVDLVATPILSPDGSVQVTKLPVQTDPARLARIRAAKMPAISEPVQFDTPQADAILSALEVFPADNPFNQLVENWPLHPNSDAIVESIGQDKPLRYNPDMGFVLVPPDQPKIDVKINDYPSESDPGPYPLPANVPIEGWPVHYQRDASLRSLTLEDVQRDRLQRGGDRHAIVVDPTRRLLYEFFGTKKTDAGWTAAQASIFDLKTNELRPTGWTSADAAGLPIFPAVVRYDELQRGMVEHALRVTVRKTRRAFVAPATHYASRFENEEYPRMGERLRLKQDFDISEFSPPVQAILKGLKRYGMFVADNGIEWAISVAPDPRIPDLHAELRKVPGSAFEVVVSPHAP